MRNARLVAGLLDEGHHVVRVLLRRVVLRRVEVGARPVVVHAQAAAHVDDARRRSHLVQPHEHPARLGQRVLVGADGRDLGADVEVQELEAVEHVLGTQALHGGHDLGRREPELRARARRLDPLARALRREAHPHSEVGPDSQLPGGLDHEVDLVEAVDHDDRSAAELLGQQRQLHVGVVLVAVADDQRVRRVQQRQRDQQLRLAARLQAHALGGAVLDDLLHHVPLLIHLDGIDAPVAAAVAVLLDGGLEGLAEPLHPAGEDVREADEQRGAQPAALEVPHQLQQVDAGARLAPRKHLDPAVGVDAEEPAAPVGDVVELETVSNGPTTTHASVAPNRPSRAAAILGGIAGVHALARPRRGAHRGSGQVVCSPVSRSRTSAAPCFTSSGPSR